MIVSMVSQMFCVLGVLIIHSIVWYAEEEVQLLHELESVDSRIYRQNLGETLVIVCFLSQVFYSVVNLWLMTRDTVDELWGYLKSGPFNIIYLLVAGFTLQSLFLLYVTLEYWQGIDTHIHHLCTNTLCLVHIAAMIAHALSRVQDVKQLRDTESVAE